jgi:gliding motility-associated-like protein
MKKLFFLFFLLLSNLTFGQENCNNGIDDDGDGKIDLNDSDCNCSNSAPLSLVNNYNFEQMLFCPNDFGQFNAASNWFTPSTASTDYINTCGFVPISAINAGIYPLPISNGNGVSGILVSQDYKEFVATCTNTTLLAGTQYQLNFDISASTSGRELTTSPSIGRVCYDGILNAGRIDITLYGKSNCSTAVPSGSNFFPAGWGVLGTATYLPSKNWNQLSIILTPSININSIMLGPPVTLPDTYLNEHSYRTCFPYFYFDNILLNNVYNLGVNINATGKFCENTLVLNTNIDASVTNNYSTQWYKNGVAIVGATNNNLIINYSALNIGNYQFKITNSNSCKISPYYNVNTVLEIPEYTIDQSPCFPGLTTITITTPGDEFSFDNGATWNSNPSMGNFTAYDRPSLLVKKNGCTSSSRYILLTYPPLETLARPELIVVQPGCQSNGSITVTTPALSYSFDDGLTWTTNQTLSNLLPNENHDYRVRIKTLLGCISSAEIIVMHSFFMPEPLVTHTNTSCGIGGSITITTPATEYSINNGLTWSNNPVFNNLPAGNYSVIIKNELGCISYEKYVYVATNYIPMPTLSVTQPSCGRLGSITVVTNAMLYSFDNGQTWTSNNRARNLLPGYYSVKIKNFNNCESFAETIYINSYFLDIPINYTFINSSCSTNGTINITTVADEYSINNGLTWNTNPLFLNLSSGYYNLKIRRGINCESNSVSAQIQDFSVIVPDYQITNAGCDTYGSINITTTADFYSFDDGVTWSTNNTISNLTGTNNYILKVKRNNCISQSININFNSNYIQRPLVNNYHAYVCDTENNQIENINLSDYNSFLINNSTNFSYFYFNTSNDATNLNLNNQIQNFNSYQISPVNSTIFVAVVTSNNCFSVSEINFSLLETPIITNILNEYILCENKNVLVRMINNSYSYLWSNGATSNSILIQQPGNYNLIASYNYGTKICSTSKDFTVVLSSPATITSIESQDWTNSENTIIVNTSGFGNYEYSINGTNYQDSNIFTDLLSGYYTVYVRDKNGCGITKDDVFVLMYPKYFTPNGDGYNDTWSIKFSYTEPNLKIIIYDRFGKILKTLNNSNPWDGKYNGNNLPSSDYWFIVTRENGKEYRGHFTLKR